MGSGTDQLVELDLDRARIAVLTVLDDEHHKKSDDRRAGIDGELPEIGEAEQGASHRPNDDNEPSRNHGSGPARPACDVRGKSRESSIKTRVAHHQSWGSCETGDGGEHIYKRQRGRP